MNHDIDSWHPLVVIETVMEWTAMMGYTVIYTVLAQVATLCYGGEYAYSFKYVWGCWTFVYLAFRQICKLERPFWSPFLIDPLLASHTTRRGAATEQWHTHTQTHNMMDTFDCDSNIYRHVHSPLSRSVRWFSTTWLFGIFLAPATDCHFVSSAQAQRDLEEQRLARQWVVDMLWAGG